MIFIKRYDTSGNCLNDCESCGKCRILRGRVAEVLYADYIEGKRSYMDITFDIRNNHY